MRISIIGSLGAVVFISSGLGVSLCAAQIQNPIQAAKDAYKKAQQQQQQKNAPQAQAAQPGTQSQPPAQAQTAAVGTAPAGDCCSADAMKNIAASLSYLDILGAKLGMTSEQAFAAIKASDPTLKIDIGPIANAFRRADGSSDEVVLEFSTPPNPPMVIKITREVIFAPNQPVVVSNLVDALRKRYGKEVTRQGHM